MTVITKCDSCFIRKCNRSLLNNVSGLLLQNTTVLLQNATVITNCDDFITKCDSYYKMLCLLQIVTIQWRIKRTKMWFNLFSQKQVIIKIKLLVGNSAITELNELKSVYFTVPK